MERLLHYVWQHHLYPLGPLITTEGQAVEVINPGLHNEDAGPDFFNAQLKIDGALWVGNVEVHSVSTDWFRHHHDTDPAYNNVILHIISRYAGPIRTAEGRTVPQLVLPVPEEVEANYQELLRQERQQPCYSFIPSLQPLFVEKWMDRLFHERLEAKVERLNQWAQRFGGDWEYAFFILLARSFGFGINSDAFQLWATHIPLLSAGKHRDNLFQIEALFLGQAGLLDEEFIPLKYREQALADGYFQRLRNEYHFLAHKFTLQPMSGAQWRFLRLRPQNFPHLRLVQLAHLFHSQRVSLSKVLEATNLEQLRSLFITDVTDYWRDHYIFGAPSNSSQKALHVRSLDSLLINAALPLLCAYGRHRMHPEYEQRAATFYHEIPAEQNRIVRQFAPAGLPVSTAAHSQALLQLYQSYCSRKDCLRCRFGHEYLRHTGVYHCLQEPQQ